MKEHDKSPQINRRAIGLIYPEKQHTGYTNTVKAMLSAYVPSKTETAEITDLSESKEQKKMGGELFAIETNAETIEKLRKAAEAEDGGKFDIISAGPVGLSFLKSLMSYPPLSTPDALERGQARIFWVSEKFYKEPFHIFQTLPAGSITMLVPERAKKLYRTEYPDLAWRLAFGEIDYMASEDKAKLKQEADDFFAKNSAKEDGFNAQAFFAGTNEKYLFLLGGGLKDEDGNLIPYSPSEFARMADVAAKEADGDDMFVAAHGGRTSEEALKEFMYKLSLSEHIQVGQKIQVFGHKFIDGVKTPHLFSWIRTRESSANAISIPFKGNAYNALGFYAATSPDVRVGVTADQALALPEHLARGGSSDQLSFHTWAMCDEEANDNATLLQEKIKSYVPTTTDVLENKSPTIDAKGKLLELEEKRAIEPRGLFAKMEYYRTFLQHYR